MNILHRLFAVGGFAHYRKPLLCLEQLPQTIPENRMIVCYQNSNFIANRMRMYYLNRESRIVAVGRECAQVSVTPQIKGLQKPAETNVWALQARFQVVMGGNRTVPVKYPPSSRVG